MIILKSFFMLPIHDWRQLWYHIDSHRVFWWTLQLSRVLGVLLPWPLWVMETRCGGGGLVWVGYDQRVFPNVVMFMEIPRATSGRVILGSCWSCWRLTRLSIVNNRSRSNKSFKRFHDLKMLTCLQILTHHIEQTDQRRNMQIQSFDGDLLWSAWRTSSYQLFNRKWTIITSNNQISPQESTLIEIKSPTKKTQSVIK